jgi:hypothetical protein
MIWPLVKELYHVFCLQLMPPGGQSKNPISPKIDRLVLTPRPLANEKKEEKKTPRPNIFLKYWVDWRCRFLWNVQNMKGWTDGEHDNGPPAQFGLRGKKSSIGQVAVNMTTKQNRNSANQWSWLLSTTQQYQVSKHTWGCSELSQIQIHNQYW